MTTSKMLKQFVKQTKTVTDDPMSIHFCSHLLTVLFYTTSKLTTTCVQTYEIKQMVFTKLFAIVKEIREHVSVSNDDLNHVIELLSLEQKKYLPLLALYIEIYCLHLQLKPFLYFYDKNYNLENDKQSIATMQSILDKISLFNSQCISILSNRYADVIKFAKLSWMDVKKYVK